LNTLLAIAIPAYNRPQVLLENLEAMLPELLETGVPVYVSDDSSQDATGEAVKAFSLKYPHVYYIRNRPGFGHDLNCLNTLAMPSTDYVWYLGDSIRILPGGLKRILALLGARQHDFLAVSARGRGVIDVPTGTYGNYAQVLETLAWHLTLTGVTIYHHRFLEDLQARYGHFVGSNLIQLGILLQNLPEGSWIHWINEEWIEGHQLKGESYWRKTPFKVFIRDWSEFILGLPEAYPLRSKHIAIRSHSLRTGILEWRALRRMHFEGLLGPRELRDYWSLWKLATGVSPFRMALLACFPVRLRRAIRSFKETTRSWRKGSRG